MSKKDREINDVIAAAGSRNKVVEIANKIGFSDPLEDELERVNKELKIERVKNAQMTLMHSSTFFSIALNLIAIAFFAFFFWSFCPFLYDVFLWIAPHNILRSIICAILLFYTLATPYDLFAGYRLINLFWTSDKQKALICDLERFFTIPTRDQIEVMDGIFVKGTVPDLVDLMRKNENFSTDHCVFRDWLIDSMARKYDDPKTGETVFVVGINYDWDVPAKLRLRLPGSEENK